MNPFLGLSVLLAGCWSATHTDPQTPATALEVEVASVSLAGDCPDPIVASIEVGPANSPSGARGAPSNASMACANGSNCHARQRASCEQTTMQLSLRSRDASGATVQIKSVELYDGAGKRLGKLAPRNPTRWGNNAYLPWNERVAAGENLTASYALSAPEVVLDPSVTYRVRVVVAIGGEERALEKPATVSVVAPALHEAPMVT